MVICMKTTFNLNLVTMQMLKREAARQGRTMTELIEAALHAFFQRRPVTQKPPPLPVFDSGGARVSVSNREALYEIMEGP